MQRASIVNPYMGFRINKKEYDAFNENLELKAHTTRLDRIDYYRKIGTLLYMGLFASSDDFDKACQEAGTKEQQTALQELLASEDEVFVIHDPHNTTYNAVIDTRSLEGVIILN